MLTAIPFYSLDRVFVTAKRVADIVTSEYPDCPRIPSVGFKGGARMKLALSVVWLTLAALFFSLGWRWVEAASQPLPPLETSEPRFEFESQGFRLEFDVVGTPLDPPFIQFEQEVDAYIERVSGELSEANQRAAWACLLGGLASMGGLLMTWSIPGAAVARPT